MAPKSSLGPGAAVANDALLIQLVRCSLGKESKTRSLPRPNVSSCKLVVTLHGCVREPEERRVIEEAVWRVPDVRGVVNKMRISRVLPSGG